MPDSKMPDAPDSAEPNAAQLSGADLARLLEQNKTLADARGVSQDTCEALYAQAFAALQKKDYENAFYLFSFLVLHRHDTDAYWQGLGHAQAGLGNYAAAAMTLLVPYERKPGAELALELAKNFTQCGLHGWRSIMPTRRAGAKAQGQDQGGRALGSGRRRHHECGGNGWRCGMAAAYAETIGEGWISWPQRSINRRIWTPQERLGGSCAARRNRPTNSLAPGVLS